MLVFRKCFVCNDTSKLEGLGFKKIRCSYEWTYSSKCQYRIAVNERNGVIQFIHHNYDTYSMFMKMVKMGIIEEQEKKINQDTKIIALEKRIAELERKLNEKESE